MKTRFHWELVKHAQATWDLLQSIHTYKIPIDKKCIVFLFTVRFDIPLSMTTGRLKAAHAIKINQLYKSKI